MRGGYSELEDAILSLTGVVNYKAPTADALGAAVAGMMDIPLPVQTVVQQIEEGRSGGNCFAMDSTVHLQDGTVTQLRVLTGKRFFRAQLYVPCVCCRGTFCRSRRSCRLIRRFEMPKMPKGQYCTEGVVDD